MKADHHTRVRVINHSVDRLTSQARLTAQFIVKLSGTVSACSVFHIAVIPCKVAVDCNQGSMTEDKLLYHSLPLLASSQYLF